MIKAIIIFYNDTPEILERCFKSLEGKAEIIAIDGAFKDFPHSEPYSTDGCKELAINYAIIYHGVNRSWENQTEKRNAAFQYLNDGDYFLVIDADEELIGDLVPKGDYTDIRIEDWNRDYYRVRLIKYKIGMKYNGRHSIISYGGRCINHASINLDAKNMTEGYIKHWKNSRPESRKEYKIKYAEIRNEEPAALVYERLKNGNHNT